MDNTQRPNQIAQPTVQLNTLSLEELNHIKIQTEAQIASAQAQIGLVQANTLVQVDRLNKQIKTLNENKSKVQARIDSTDEQVPA